MYEPMEALKKGFHNVKVQVGLEEKDELSLENLDALCPSLTYKQRILGWLGCIGIAILLAVISIISLIKLAGSPAKFAIPYTLCNVFLLVSTFFLIGPKAQCRVMCRKYRALTSVIFVISMICTLVVAFVDMNKALQMVLVLFFVGVQVIALVWYSLSFIPYGRNICYQCCCKGKVDTALRAVV